MHTTQSWWNWVRGTTKEPSKRASGATTLQTHVRHSSCKTWDRILQPIQFYTPKSGRNSPFHRYHILLLPNQGFREGQICHSRRVSWWSHWTLYHPWKNTQESVSSATNSPRFKKSALQCPPTNGFTLQVSCTMIPSCIKSSPVFHLQLPSFTVLDLVVSRSYAGLSFQQLLQ